MDLSVSLDFKQVGRGAEDPLRPTVRGDRNGAKPLPCLYSNISIENNPFIELEVPVSKQFLKSSNALTWNVFYFANSFGIENIGFLTLTFKDHVLCPKEAQKRLNSLISNVIKKRYSEYIGVMERQKSGRIHYHLLVHVGSDIRSGVDFNMMIDGDYSTAGKDLRSEWSFWRKTAPKYRFGRTELMPIKSTEEAIGRYVGKYIGKHMESRKQEDKNARLVRYSRGARVASTRFSFVSDGSASWRKKVAVFAAYVAERHGCEATMENIAKICGPRWAYHHREFIASLPG